MTEQERLMLEDLAMQQEGTGRQIAVKRWKQGYHVGKRVERERILNIIQLEHKLESQLRGKSNFLLLSITAQIIGSTNV